MKKTLVALSASLLAFTASAQTKEPELWICKISNSSEPMNLYLVYREGDFMLFGGQGGLLNLGTLKVGNMDGVGFLYATLEMKSGRRNMYLYNVPGVTKEDRVMKMQIMTSDGQASDDFLCR